MKTQNNERTLTEKIRIFTKAYRDYKTIQDDEDLRKNQLTLHEYHILQNVLSDLSAIKDKVVYCISEKVAKWCERHDFKVESPYDNQVNYKIYL